MSQSSAENTSLPDEMSAPAQPLRRLSRAEFAAHFEESFRVLWLVAAGVVRDSSAADDVVQEAAVIAMGKLDDYQAGTNFRAWMASIVRFVALNMLRRQKSHGVLGQEIAAPLAAASDSGIDSRGALQADQTWFDDRVVAALHELAPLARACLLLRSVEGLSYEELARMLDIPEGTAMSHVHRARTRLREVLAGHEPVPQRRDPS